MDKFETMHIDEFEALARRDVEAFFLWWRKQNKMDAENFPMELMEGEWWEMLVTSEDNAKTR